jgi:hypothetical protein
MDVTITASVGSYSLDIAADNTDALFLADALHSIALHLEQMQKLPAVKKAMSTPIKVDDLD